MLIRRILDPRLIVELGESLVDKPSNRLTPLEQAGIMRLIHEGKSNWDIMGAYGVNNNQVDYYRKKYKARLKGTKNA